MATPGIAVPGSSVPTSSPVAPGGAQGVQGIQGLLGAQGPSGPNVVSADAGNAALLGSDSRIYVPQTFGKYYGTDPTNATNLVVTVDSSFQLLPGVVVYVTPSVGITANPTLNVNGTGAIPVVNRANIALLANELSQGGRMFGVVYDGTNWRVITPLTRIYNATNPASTTSLECLGFDAIAVFIQFTVSTSCNLTLAHLAEGIDVYVCFGNAFTGPLNYSIAATNTANAALGTFLCNNTGVAGAGAATLSVSLSLSITNGNNAVYVGRVVGGRLMFK